jgi:coenzyme F420-reducing hydrogenase delta subunit
MCGGRVDPIFVIEAFACGADGVFVGTCLEGECHYSTGNLEAKVKMEITRRVLARGGIDPGRLVLRMMSSAEGAKFVSYVSEFVAAIEELGPLRAGPDEAGLPLATKLEAAGMALAGKKLRWIAGKATQFASEGNLYGEVFTEHELGRLYEEVVSDEYAKRLIVAVLCEGNGEGVSAKDLAQTLGQRPASVLRHLVELRRLGLVDISEAKETAPLWHPVGEPIGG